MWFGKDLHLNLETALQVLAPNILNVARHGSQRDVLNSLLQQIDTNTKSMFILSFTLPLVAWFVEQLL